MKPGPLSQGRAMTVALALLVPVLAGAMVGAAPGLAGADVAPAAISGSGSSWAAGAISEWTTAVQSNNQLQVNYTDDGDAAGRQDFANKVSTFAVTSEGFQGGSDTSQGRAYAYLPVAAGGTSFPYQIRVDGQQVENLRLSGETLAKIFTNQITNWDDPEITADNNGQQLPNLPIIPVVQSEGSGSTYQLTDWLSSQFPSIWNPFAGAPGPTEYFPRAGNQIAQNGSDASMNYVASSEANGSIGYVEYFYPLQVGYPVAKVLNAAGYFTLPTQYNVAVSLEQAQINMDPSSPDYLLQSLSNVYTDPDPRTYPLSSYVYMIEPTGANDSSVTPGMAQTLADFEYYAICQGQAGIGANGYSPLPVNLVEAAFGQVQKLQAAWPAIDISNLNITTCDNPTFVPGQPNENYLAQIAPLPPPCDKEGAGPCAAGVTPNGIGPTPTSSGTAPGATSAVSGGAAGGGGGGSGGTTAGSTAAAAGTVTKGATGSGVASSISALDARASSVPSIDGTDLPAAAGSSFLDRIAPWAVVPLLALFALPLVIGYRRARARAITPIDAEAGAAP
jgi:phosphate transport system substrate-binding protein